MSRLASGPPGRAAEAEREAERWWENQAARVGLEVVAGVKVSLFGGLGPVRAIADFVGNRRWHLGTTGSPTKRYGSGTARTGRTVSM
jgi:hypothetical protein